MKRYVIYRRVSTKEQGNRGHGLDAQKRDLRLYLETHAAQPFEIAGEFEDIGSGADNGRPQLQEALALVRKLNAGLKDVKNNPGAAELLIAKLDRVSRKVSMVAQITDDPKVRLRVASMPHASNFELHIYAALAEQEREFISQRTKAALAEVKDKGKKLGGYRMLKDGTGSLDKANSIRKDAADEHALMVIDTIQPLRDAKKTLREIAETLTKTGVKTARGGTMWTATAVKRVLDRMGADQV